MEHAVEPSHLGAQTPGADPSEFSPGLLQLFRLASPALPIGGFSYSEGLEAAIDSGLVNNEADVAQWLTAQLQLTQSRSEISIVAAATHAVRSDDEQRLKALDQWVLSTRESSESRLQTEQMGHSLTRWRHELAPQPEHVPWYPTYPIAYAIAAAHSAASVPDICAAFAFCWAENMVQAALKAVPLGQNAGQRILAQLCSQIPAAVKQALTVQDTNRQAFAPMLAIICAQHETQYSRLFRS